MLLIKDLTAPRQLKWVYHRPRSALLRYGQWIVLPILICCVAECVMRPWIAQREAGYLTIMTAPPAGRVDAIFVGVSRVEAAIDADAFDARMRHLTGKPWKSLNLGGAGRPLSLHWLGLRDLFEKYPSQFTGCRVFVEAPMGMPSDATWADRWLDPINPRPVIASLRVGDIPPMLHSEKTLSNQIDTLFLLAQRPFHIAYYRRLIRQRSLERLDTLSARLCSAGEVDSDSPATLDMRAGGTIRVDADAAEVGRRTATAAADEARAGQRPVADWDATVLADISRLTRAHGGSLVLYEMPVHPVFTPVFHSLTRQADIARLETILPRWNAEYVTVPFACAGSDFPDIWHLRRSLAGA